MSAFLAAVRAMATSQQSQTRMNFLFNLLRLLNYHHLRRCSDVGENYWQLLVDG